MQYPGINEITPHGFFNRDSQNNQENLIHSIEHYFAKGMTVFPISIKLIAVNGVLKKDIIFSFKWRQEKITKEKALDKLSEGIWNGIAILTGEEHNLFVLDIDVSDGRNGNDFIERNGILIPKNTPKVITQSGGVHFYFAYPKKIRGKSTQSFKEYGVDTRGNGGLIIAPPSLIDNYHYYRWKVPLNGELKAPPVDLIEFLFPEPKQVTYSFAEIHQLSKQLTSNDEKKKFFELLEKSNCAPIGKRSEADYAVVSCGIKIGLTKEEIFNHVRNSGKFAEKSQKGLLEYYFERTYQNAQKALNENNLLLSEKSVYELAEIKVMDIITQGNRGELFDFAGNLAKLTEAEYGKIRILIKDKLGNKFPITQLDKAVDEHRRLLKLIVKPRTFEQEILGILDESIDIVELYPVQDFKDDKMWYCTDSKNGILLINSEWEALFLDEIEEHQGIRIKSYPSVFRLSPATVSAFLKNPTILDELYQQKKCLAYNLFYRINTYLRRFIYFVDPKYSELLSVWIMGTYIFSLFQYFPYLHLKAEKRSGKTLLMDAMSKIAFNGELVTNITEASLFRDIQANRITLFLDEVERMRKIDKDLHGSLMMILNSGFNYNGTVKRTEKFNDQFIVKNYSSYSPKVFAGINEIDDVLKDRTIPIPILRKTKNEKVERFKIDKNLEKEIFEIVQDSFLFGLFYAKQLNDYMNQPKIDLAKTLPEELNDREKDIFEPLFAIASVIQFEGSMKGAEINLVENLRFIARSSAAFRKDDDTENNETSKVVKIISEIMESGKVSPLKDADHCSYYCRDEVYGVYMREYQKDYFPSIGTRTKFVRLLNKTINLKPEAFLHRPNKKEYSIRKELLKDLKDRFL